MPLALHNTPVTFRRAVDILVSRFKRMICILYLDDIMIIFKYTEDHLQNATHVVTVLPDAGITLKLRECELITDSVQFLGNIIGLVPLPMAQARAKSFVGAKQSRNEMDLARSSASRMCADFTSLTSLTSQCL